MRTLQFELWKECDNGCFFCYSGSGCVRKPRNKEEILDFVLNYINDVANMDNFNGISLIGGEMFQGQLENSTQKQKFKEIVAKIGDLISSGAIQQFWLNATMTKSDQEFLFDVIRLIHDQKDVILCTSYDTFGRFKDDQTLKCWIDNLKNIRRHFKDIQIVVNVIVTGYYIEEYLNGDRILHDLRDNYGVHVNYKQPYMGNVKNMPQGFFPHRRGMLEFMKKYKNTNTEDQWRRLFSNDNRADMFIDCEQTVERNRLYSNIRLKDIIDEIGDFSMKNRLSCGHLADYGCYCDSTRCILCDKEVL